MALPHCTPTSNELKNLLLTVLDSETVASSQSIIEAARIQGHWTFYAGICALIAGILAYLASQRKNSMEENQQKTKAIAYNHHLLTLLRAMKSDLIDVSEWADSVIKDANKNNSTEIINVPIPNIEIPKDIESSEWESHALLPMTIAQKLYQLYRALSVLQKGLNEIKSHHLKLDDCLKKAYQEYSDERSQEIRRLGNVESLLSQHLSCTTQIVRQLIKDIKRHINDLAKPSCWRLLTLRFCNMIVHKQ